LNLDDRFGLTELGCQSLVLSFEPLVLGNQGSLGRGFPPAAFGRQAGQRAFLPLLPPSGQMRRVQALAPQQGPELPRLRATIGLPKHPELVLGGEPSPDGLF
jgi:hypothetical protein